MKSARFALATRRLLTAAAGMTLLTMTAMSFAPAATAQSPTLVLRLKADLACTEPEAGNQLLINADTLGVSLPDLLAALDDLSVDASACTQIKDAASALSRQLSESNPSLDAEQAAAAAERMQQVLAEADQRAASVRFEVGPPPRNLTRNREAPR